MLYIYISKRMLRNAFVLKFKLELLVRGEKHGTETRGRRSPPECDTKCRICCVHVLENRCPVNLVRNGRIDVIRNRNRCGLQGRGKDRVAFIC